MPFLVGALVWICASLMVGYVWRSAQHRAERNAMVELESEADLVVSLMQQRLQAFELITIGGASLATGTTMPTREEWNDYVAGLDLAPRFPSIIGLGYARDIDSVELPAVQMAMKAETGELFRIQPWGVRAEYGPVVYLAPETAERRWLERRRAALDLG